MSISSGSSRRIFKERLPGDHTGGETAQILRFDKNIQWVLNRPESLYVEMALTELIATLPWIQGAGQAMAEAVAKGNRSLSAKIDKTKQRETIAGMEASLFVLHLKGVEENADGKVEYRIRDYVWLTEELPGKEEVDTLRTKLRNSVGTDISFLPVAIGLYDRFPGATRMLMDERNALNGYPLRDSLTLHLTGPGKKYKEEDANLIPLFILNVTLARQEAFPAAIFEPPEEFRKKERE
jgi:hypothetical protein